MEPTVNAVQGHIGKTIFDKDFKNHRESDTRSIYFFELKRMIEFLEEDVTVTSEILKLVYEYHDLREKQYRDVYGDWRFHDDSNYLSPIEEEQDDVEPDNKVIDLTAGDEDKHPQQTSQSNASEAQHEQSSTFNYQDQKERLMKRYMQINREFSYRPTYVPYVLDNPLTFKGINQETDRIYFYIYSI